MKLNKIQITQLIVVVLILAIIPITVLFSQKQQVFKSQAQSVSDSTVYPRPNFDTGLGIHWSADGGHMDAATASNSVCLLKSYGFSWIKLVAGGGSAVSFAQIMRQNDIEPIIRLYRNQPNPGTLPQADLDAVSQYVGVGAVYIEPNNEPNLAVEWQNGQLPSCGSAATQSMQNWVQDAVHIQQKGGIPLFPALAPGGNCDDRTFLHDSFEYLKNNSCQLANGSSGSCLNLFDGPSSNGKPAVMSIHNYNLKYDNAGTRGAIQWDVSGKNGFMRFTDYDATINSYLGKSIPILATEDGATTNADAPGWMPDTSLDWHRDVTEAMAQYQMNNTSPYNFNTAFWLAFPNHPWEVNGYFNDDFSEKLNQTMGALKVLPKKSRNGSAAPTSCSPNGTASPSGNPTAPPSGNPTAPPSSNNSCKLTTQSTLTQSCVSCILSKWPNLRPAYSFFGQATCTDNQLITNWCQNLNPSACGVTKQLQCTSECR